MFCKNCGNEMKDTEKFCAVCGTPVETAAEQPQPAPKDTAGASAEKVAGAVSQVAEKVTGAASQAAETVAKKAQEMGGKGKEAWKKASGEGSSLRGLFQGKNKILWIMCAVVLVVAIPCVANAARLNNFFHKTFSSPEKYFQFVAKREADEISGLIGGYYGDVTSRLDIYDSGYSGEITLEPGEEIQKLVKLADAYLEEVGVDLSAMKSLKVGVNASRKDNVMGLGLTTAVNKTNLFSANMVMDMDQGGVYLQIPELTKTYLGVEAEDYTDDWDDLLESQEMGKELIKSLPGSSEIEKLARRYLKIVAENIDNVSIGRKKELKVEGISQKCTELKVTVDGETMQKVMEAVLEETLRDKSLEKILVNVANAAGQDGDEVYEELTDEWERMLDRADDLADTDEEWKIVVYVDAKGNVIGLSVEEPDYDRYEFSYSMLTARKGNDIGYEISVVRWNEKEVEITGKGKLSGNLLTGEFQVGGSGHSLLELKVSGLDIEKVKRGYLNGKLEIALSSEVSKALSNEIDIPAISSIIKKSSLTLDCKTSAKSAEWKATVNYDGEKLLSLALDLKSGNGSKTSIPSGKSVILVEDADDIMDYYEEIDWNKFLAGLEKTEVFAETADLLEDVIDDLEDYLDMLSGSVGLSDLVGDDIPLASQEATAL